MARKTKEEAQETRRSILSAAVDVFWERGVASASLENIAERAGVTRGAVYWHFKNKLDIFEALHEELHQFFYESILEDVRNDHPFPMRQLEELCVSLLHDLQRNERSRRILSIFILRCDYTGELEHFLERQSETKSESAALFAQYFARAVKKGHLAPDVDPQLLTVSLFCYTSGIIHEHLRYPDFLDMKKQAAPLIRQFFRGVEQRPESK